MIDWTFFTECSCCSTWFDRMIGPRNCRFVCWGSCSIRVREGREGTLGSNLESQVSSAGTWDTITRLTSEFTGDRRRQVGLVAGWRLVMEPTSKFEGLVGGRKFRPVDDAAHFIAVPVFLSQWRWRRTKGRWTTTRAPTVFCCRSSMSLRGRRRLEASSTSSVCFIASWAWPSSPTSSWELSRKSPAVPAR